MGTQAASNPSSARFESLKLLPDAVMIDEELKQRPSRAPDHQAESAALVMLARELARSPRTILQRLAETAMHLTGAESGGISLAESADGREQFRWVATAGEFGRYLHGTMERHASPCGVVLERNAALTIREPERCFPFAVTPHVPIREVILAPFHRGPVPVGTVWVIAHSPDKHFDAEDLRMLQSLSAFASAAKETVDGHDRLRDGYRRKTEFLAMLAHELRNHLAPMRNGLGLLAHENADAAAVARVREMMDRQVDRMTRLVEDLMDVSRIENGKLEVRRLPVDLETVLQEAIEVCQPLLQAQQHELTVELPAQPIVVLGDLDRLAQVFCNLITNAAKYTPAKGLIRLSAHVAERSVAVEVQDNGAGIARDMLAQVFDMFAQVDRTADHAQGGLGIGLTLVRRLVELHGGTVRARSDGEGKGSAFTVTLPLSACAGGTRPTATADKAAGTPSG